MQQPISTTFKAMPMPDFTKTHMQPKVEKQVTVPTEFNLESERRRQIAIQALKAKTEAEDRIQESQRKFTAQPLPNYEKMAINVMPSDRPITVAVKPNFVSDLLPKRVAKPASPRRGPKDFVF